MKPLLHSTHDREEIKGVALLMVHMVYTYWLRIRSFPLSYSCSKITYFYQFSKQNYLKVKLRERCFRGKMSKFGKIKMAVTSEQSKL